MPPDSTPYHNSSGTDVDGRGALRWMLERIRKGRLLPPKANLPVVAPDLAFLHANASVPTATWIGHATTLLQVAGHNILTDPVFSTFASPVPFAGPRRMQPPGVRLHDLPHIHAVVLSHNHFDHLDLRSVRALQRQAGGPPHFFVPAGVDAWFRRHVASASAAPLRISPAHWDDSIEGIEGLPGFAFHFLEVQHWSSRSALRRNDTPWGSWAVLHPEFRFWFSGDLGYSPAPQRIGARFGGFDLAAISIGAYEPRWLMRPQHVNPDEAVQVMLDVQARAALGVHWGTFALADEAPAQPPVDLAAAMAARGLSPARFFVLRHGETRRFPTREVHE
jgi:N-acyl-phosphatidylethanolamine-hydrolysing phospholipase D